VQFSVTPSSGVTTGTRLTEKATIVFENLPPIDTPSVFNTLQVGTPSSYVNPLASPVLDTNINLSWVGVGVPGGNGIASYSIYVSQNGGSYTAWLSNTTALQATYPGTPGSTYAFFSIALDNSGGVQPVPGAPDATVYVSSNLPPNISAISNAVITPDGTFKRKIIATDPNGDRLTYSLGSGSPAGAVINPTNGLFSWHPGRANAETTNFVTVNVIDNGYPALNTNGMFKIVVTDYLDISLGSTNIQSGETNSIPLNIQSSGGVTNLTLTVAVPQNLFTFGTPTTTNVSVGSLNVQNLGTNIVIALASASGQGFDTNNPLALVSFADNMSNSVSQVVVLPILSATGLKPDGTTYVNYVLHSGNVVIVRDKPVIQPLFGTNHTRTLTLYGKPGANYELQYSTNLSGAITWLPALDYTQTNPVILQSVDTNNPTIFYRLLQK
jgi:hypothetical protein